MPRFPYTYLRFNPSRTIAVAGCHVLVLDSQTGEILCSTSSTPRNDLHSSPIRYIAINSEFDRLATTSNDKVLKIWDLENLTVLNSRDLPKKCTSILFTRDGQTLVVADKFGDVFSYPVEPVHPTQPRSTEQQQQSKRGSLASHSNPSGGTLVLGHTSIITSSILTPSEKFIITADRDEHIRVSRFPDGWDIERYCLGHNKYVSSLLIPAHSPDILISGGGDPTLRFWNFIAGTLFGEVEVWSSVQPYFKVASERADFVRLGEERGGGWIKKGRVGKRRKGKGKAEDAPAEEIPIEEEAPASVENGQSPDKLHVLVVSKLGILDIPGTRILIFSATGTSALFYTQYPESFPFEQPIIQNVDLTVPLLDFEIIDGLVWVSVDADYGAGQGAIESPMVRLLEWNSDKLVEITGLPLLTNLNNIVLQATAEELKSLELYDALTLLPKNEATDVDDFTGDLPVPSEDGAADASGSRFKGRKRVQAKLERVKLSQGEEPEGKKPRLDP